MKRIVKTQIPPLLAAWVAQTQNSDNKLYKDMTAVVKDELRNRLIKEQFYLCAYTGINISDFNFHIEHIYPRNLSKINKTREDVDYFNVLACYPAAKYKDDCYFGANKKDEWWDKAKFISPLDPSCAAKFIFNWSGKISPFSGNVAATETIKVLALDHSQLNSLRKASIDSFFGFDRGTSITKTQARKLLVKIDEPEGGRLRPFCFVLKQLLEKYVVGGQS